jgi:hypothetical protein
MEEIAAIHAKEFGHENAPWGLEAGSQKELRKSVCNLYARYYLFDIYVLNFIPKTAR